MLFEKIHLEESEKVLRVVRKHWFIIVSELIAIAMMALFPFVILFTLTFLPAELQFFSLDAENVLQVTTFVIAGWLLLSFMAGFMIWTNYYLDLWIITDRRIIYVDQKSFFNRNVSMFRLERLQDIEIKTVGLLQTFLNYGSLSAQTAGSTESNFDSTGLPDPRGLQAIIQRAMDARLKNLHTSDTASIH